MLDIAVLHHSLVGYVDRDYLVVFEGGMLEPGECQHGHVDLFVFMIPVKCSLIYLCPDQSVDMS